MSTRTPEVDGPFKTRFAPEVDEYTFQHVHTNSPGAEPTTEILEKAYSNQVAGGLPDIAVSANQGKYLQVQARIANAKQILEFGTLGGYSTLFLAHTSPDTKVTTIEYSPKHAKVARANFELAGVADRVTVLEGAGVDVVAKILEEYEAGLRPPFDFTFIDADKQSNWIYFDHAVKLSRPGAVIIVDNVVRNGGLVDPALQQEPRVVGSREVIEKSGSDPRVVTSLLQTVGNKNYDGMLISIKL